MLTKPSNSQFDFEKTQIPILVLGFLHTLFSGYGQSFFLSIFVDDFLIDFDLTRGEFGKIYGWATFLSALALQSIGSQIDKRPLHLYSLFNALLLTFCCFIIPLGDHWLWLFVCIFFLRFCGQGQMSHISSTLIARTFSARRGRALSWTQLGYPFSEIMLPPLYLIMQSSLGWNGSFIILGIILLFIFIPISQSIFNKNPSLKDPSHREDKPLISEVSFSRKDVLKSIQFYCIVPQSVLAPFLITGFFIHQGALNQFSTNWSASWFATSLTGFAIARAMGSFFVGKGIDKWKASQLFPFFTLPIAAGIINTLYFQSSLSLVILFTLCGATAGLGGNIKSALLAECFGTKNLGAIRSVFSFCLLSSTAISPALAGTLLEKGFDYETLFKYSMLIIGVSIALTLYPYLYQKKVSQY